MINGKDITSANLNEMDLSDIRPIDREWIPIIARPGDKIRLTGQGLGGKELYLVEIIRSWTQGE